MLSFVIKTRDERIKKNKQIYSVKCFFNETTDKEGRHARLNESSE